MILGSAVAQTNSLVGDALLIAIPLPGGWVAILAWTTVPNLATCRVNHNKAVHSELYSTATGVFLGRRLSR